MLDAIRNLKTSDIVLKQCLPPHECEWLLAQLCSRPGIAAVRCAGDARRLTVEYDADELVTSDVVAFLGQCGVHVAAVHFVQI
jgi:hypothetical protein